MNTPKPLNTLRLVVWPGINWTRAVYLARMFMQDYPDGKGLGIRNTALYWREGETGVLVYTTKTSIVVRLNE